MDNSNNEMINLPNGDVLAFDECLYNLCNTRDIDVYLDLLFALRDRYLIILSIKDTPGHKMSAATFDRVRSIGFSELTKNSWRTYIGVINQGDIIYNKSGDNAGDPLEYYEKIDDLNLAVSSKAYLQGNISEIIINGEDFSLNSRGWNIVIYDVVSKMVVDSATYDSHIANTAFYHKDLKFNKSYFNSHFFINEKYINGWIEKYQKKYFSNYELDSKEISHGILEPIREINGRNCGGVCDEKFNFIAGHTKKAGAGPYNECSQCYEVNENDLEYIDDTVIYGGVMFNHPGHMIIDSVAERLWWVLKHPEVDYKIVVVSWVWGSGSSMFIKEYMEVLNIPEDRLIIVSKPTKFYKIIVPDQSHVLLSLETPYEYTKEFSSVFEYIRNHLIPSTHKKIYLTKSKTGKKNIIGEDYFIEFYKNKGFTIIDPQDYTIKEKAELMYGADEVVSTLGTNTHFLIFCKPTVKLTILTRVAFESCSGQLLVNQAANIKDITIVNIASDFLHRNFVRGLNLICVTDEFKIYAKKVYNEDVVIDSREALKNIVFDYLQYFPEYYSSPRPFDTIKNQKMVTVLQNMSEVFLGKEFDTAGLNLTTNEDNLRNQVKLLTSDLTASKNRVAELEKTDVFKAAKLLEATNNKLEKQVNELRNALNNMQSLQTEIDKLTALNSELTSQNKDLINQRYKLEKQKYELEKTNLQTNHIFEMLNKDHEFAQERIKELSEKLKKVHAEKDDLIIDKTKLNNQIADYEQSRSWRLTKPLRSTARFFRKIFGKKQ